MSTLPPDPRVHAAGQRSQSGTELISSAYTGFAVTQEGRKDSLLLLTVGLAGKLYFKARRSTRTPQT